MMETKSNLIDWFKTNKFKKVSHGLEKLNEELGIKIKEYDDRFVLNYCQIESPKTHPVVIESRGIILREDFEVLCRPFDRFFNVGEAPDITEKVSVRSADIYEKVDGSLVKVYNDGEWQVATRGTAFAESANYTGQIFQDLIVEAFGCDSIQELRKKVDILSPNCTFIFEFTSPKNRIVTPYTEDKMYLLGIRNNFTGREYPIGVVRSIYEVLASRGLNVEMPKVYTFFSHDELVDASKKLDGLKEGFVVHDYRNNTRVKLKTEKYVAVHKLRGDSLPTPNKIMALVVTNETDEYLAYFPEDKQLFTEYLESWDTLQTEMCNLYNKEKDIKEQKEFALAVKDKCYSGVLFQSRAKQQNPIHVINALDPNKKIKILSTYMHKDKE